MTRAKSFQMPTLAFTLVGLLFASNALGTQPNKPSRLPALNPQPSIVDVSLRDGGVLIGQVIDTKRMPMSSHEVVIRSQSKPIATVMTDAHGRFAIRGVRAGTHAIETANGSGTFQLWAPRTAPPSAKTTAVIVSQRGVVMRGQDPDQRRRVAGAVAVGAAIAGGLWALDYNDSGS